MSPRTSAGRLRALYRQLMDSYGPRGWWPIAGTRAVRGPGRGPGRGYHPGSFALPHTRRQRFEIVLGAILTQNAAWGNVEQALAALFDAGISTPEAVLDASTERIAGLIRPAGYFNQKARKLEVIARFFSGRGALSLSGAPSRESLLSQWGVGPETADSILLYAFQVPVFVVDAYTRRILGRMGLIEPKESYDRIQQRFHQALDAEHRVFNEYHALLVEHAKRHCRSLPSCAGCPVRGCASRSIRAPRA
jgi:endonuclease-3 related protein